MVTAVVQQRAISERLQAMGRRAAAIVVANPQWSFPAKVSGLRVLFITDDWIAGASLMGRSPQRLQGRVAATARRAEVLVAVTPPLIERLRSLGAAPDLPAAVIPNGAPAIDRGAGLRSPSAGVVGQLNERLDLALLEAVADAGFQLRLIGPRRDRKPAFRARLDRLVERDNVVWTGGLDGPALNRELSTISVGLTPYTDSAFNRSSFPLKTLEYLAAGVSVVSTDLAASRWLDTEHVRIAESVPDFVAAVRAAIAAASTEEDTVEERMAFAATHGWPQRAKDFLQVIDNEMGRTRPDS